MPEDPQLKRKWAAALGKEPRPKGVVCDIHFKPNDFHQPVNSMVEFGARRRRMLKPDAVPTISRWATKKGSKSVTNHTEGVKHPCFVNNCSGHGEFRFPGDEDLLARWELVVGGHDPRNRRSRTTVICAKHFLEEDMIEDGIVSGYNANGKPRKMLRPWAVPVLDLTPKPDWKMEVDPLEEDNSERVHELGEPAFIMFKEEPRPSRPYPCPFCNYIYTSVLGMNQHMLNEHGFPGPCHPCKLCHCVMTTLDSWNAHYPKCPW